MEEKTRRIYRIKREEDETTRKTTKRKRRRLGAYISIRYSNSWRWKSFTRINRPFPSASERTRQHYAHGPIYIYINTLYNTEIPSAHHTILLYDSHLFLLPFVILSLSFFYVLGWKMLFRHASFVFWSGKIARTTVIRPS